MRNSMKMAMNRKLFLWAAVLTVMLTLMIGGRSLLKADSALPELQLGENTITFDADTWEKEYSLKFTPNPGSTKSYVRYRFKPDNENTELYFEFFGGSLGQNGSQDFLYYPGESVKVRISKASEYQKELKLTIQRMPDVDKVESTGTPPTTTAKEFFSLAACRAMKVKLTLKDGTTETWRVDDFSRGFFGYSYFQEYYKDSGLTQRIDDPENYSGIAYTRMSWQPMKDNTSPIESYPAAFILKPYNDSNYPLISEGKNHTGTVKKVSDIQLLNYAQFRIKPEHTGIYQFVSFDAHVECPTPYTPGWGGYSPCIEKGTAYTYLKEGEEYPVTVYLREGADGTYADSGYFYYVKCPLIKQSKINLPQDTTVTWNNYEKAITKTFTYLDPVSGQTKELTADFGDYLPIDSEGYCLDSAIRIEPISGNQYQVKVVNDFPYDGNGVERGQAGFVDFDSEAIVNIEMPVGVVQKTSDTPKTTVNDLEYTVPAEECAEIAEGNIDVGVSVEAEKKNESAAEGAQEINQTLPEGSNAELYLDLSLFKTVTPTADPSEASSTNIGTSNSAVFRLAIEYDTANKDIQMVRYHDGQAQLLTKLDAEPTGNYQDGTYYVGDGFVAVYASGFSTFTFANKPKPSNNVTIKKAPQSVTTAVKKNKVTVSWKKIKKDSGGNKLLKQIKQIEVQYAANSNFTQNVKTKKVGKTKTKAVLNLKDLMYYIRVRYVGSTGVSKWSKTTAAVIKAPASLKAKVKGAKVTLSWKGLSKNKSGKKFLKQIKNIQVQYSTDKKFKKSVKTKTVKKSKTTVALKLKSKTKYYIRVRYKAGSGESNWSSVKAVKTK